MPIEKKLFRSGPYADLFSQGVQVGNTLYMAGQVAMDEAGGIPEDLVEQMKLAYQNVAAVLAEFGADMDNIVDETWFVTDVNDCMAQVEALFTERHMIYGNECTSNVRARFRGRSRRRSRRPAFVHRNRGGSKSRTQLGAHVSKRLPTHPQPEPLIHQIK